MIECACGAEFDPIFYRWLCPACGMKNSCCEGEAAPISQDEREEC